MENEPVFLSLTAVKLSQQRGVFESLIAKESTNLYIKGVSIALCTWNSLERN